MAVKWISGTLVPLLPGQRAELVCIVWDWCTGWANCSFYYLIFSFVVNLSVALHTSTAVIFWTSFFSLADERR